MDISISALGSLVAARGYDYYKSRDGKCLFVYIGDEDGYMCVTSYEAFKELLDLYPPCGRYEHWNNV